MTEILEQDLQKSQNYNLVKQNFPIITKKEIQTKKDKLSKTLSKQFGDQQEQAALVNALVTRVTPYFLPIRKKKK